MSTRSIALSCCGSFQCDIRGYLGGLSTCHHGWELLDADQLAPWKDQPLVYYKKFRVYYQEFEAAAAPSRASSNLTRSSSSHVQTSRSDWGIAADGDFAEYDVPRCAAGTPTAECTHTITGTWIPVPAGRTKTHLVLMHAHCHAPTCECATAWPVKRKELPPAAGQSLVKRLAPALARAKP